MNTDSIPETFAPFIYLACHRRCVLPFQVVVVVTRMCSIATKVLFLPLVCSSSDQKHLWLCHPKTFMYHDTLPNMKWWYQTLNLCYFSSIHIAMYPIQFKEYIYADHYLIAINCSCRIQREGSYLLLWLISPSWTSFTERKKHQRLPLQLNPVTVQCFGLYVPSEVWGINPTEVFSTNPHDVSLATWSSLLANLLLKALQQRKKQHIKHQYLLNLNKHITFIVTFTSTIAAKDPTMEGDTPSI